MSSDDTPPRSLPEQGPENLPFPQDLQQRVQLLEVERDGLRAQNEDLQQTVLDLQAAGRASSALFDAAPVSYLVLDQLGQIQEANPQACVMLAVPHARLIGRRFAPFMTPAGHTHSAFLLGRTFDGPNKQTQELTLSPASGPPLQVILESVADHPGTEPRCCRITLTDITQHQVAHQTMQLAHEHLAGHVQERSARVRALGEEFEQVVSAVTGEVQTALHRALNVLTLLDQELPSAVPAGPHLGHLRDTLQQITALISSLTGYLRARRLRVRMRAVNLKVALREVQKDLGPQFVGRTVRFTSDDLPVVQGDSQALQLILTQLLANAVKFTRGRDEARIHVSVQETTETYVIGVHDNGVGFNLRHKDRLFQVFGRLHSGGSFEGAGVGLAIVGRMCERFGGRAWGEGKVDQGASFWFAWPKHPAVLE